MSASRKQIALIEQLIDRGARIPEQDSGGPDNSMFKSVQAADAFIKQWGHLMRKHSTALQIWGGIPNC